MRDRPRAGSVIRRLERLQAGVPEAVGKAIAPSYWKERLRQVALVTLRAQWALERNVQTRALYERVTHRLVGSMTGEMAGPLLAQYSMALQHVAEGEVSTALNFAEAAEYHLTQRTPSGLSKAAHVETPTGTVFVMNQGTLADEENLAAARQAILDWVRIEKDKDDRDAGLTDEEIAARIEHILGIGERVVPRERTEAMRAASGDLIEAIQQWLAGGGQNPPTRPGRELAPRQQMSPAVLGAWFQAVLLAWRAYVALHLRDRIEMELIRLKRRVETELL